ncbi:tetratricopeptide repeat protein [Thalassotalea euphylliae]|uniref:Tetratricopeptide repeat protein n=1 Tax=Thalassotalea euphylliae TaxID=1655234 RepID=A0A3E0TR83_9GAMM|nr:tetratricopeptide repeat protein [Thalassotalea euphylliae]REL26973.1 tetratricopeptide repeat protein [Thalassotalea euphylliae]
MHKVALLLLPFVFSLVGCNATTPVTSAGVASVNPELLIVDDAFPNAKNLGVESQDEIFALSDEMRSVVRSSFMSERSKHNKAMKLIRHIFSDNNAGLAYQSNANLTASQAYHSKTANCMSLTIMAYAMAKASGLDIVFQDVKVPEYWVRNGEYNLLTGHVNLLVPGVRSNDPNVNVVWGGSDIEIDFDPFVKKKKFPKKKVGINTVTAMFYNNKGADALVKSDYDTAYRYFSEAVKIAPNFSSGWANLGILYRFTGQNELAEATYRHAISIDGKSLNTLTNLSILLAMEGRFDEARRIDSAILKQRIRNPYYHALLADEDFYEGNFESAIRHYQRAIKIDGSIHEFHYGLAKIFNALGRKESAKIAMKRAIRSNKSPDIERQYLAKLSIINQ